MPRPISYAVFCLKKKTKLIYKHPFNTRSSAIAVSFRLTVALPSFVISAVFCFNDTPSTEIYTLSLHDALPICDVLATDNNTVGMGDAGIKSAIQGSNVPNPDEAVPSFVSGAMAKAGKGLLEGTLQAGTSAVSDKLLDLVGLGGKSAADKG